MSFHNFFSYFPVFATTLSSYCDNPITYMGFLKRPIRYNSLIKSSLFPGSIGSLSLTGRTKSKRSKSYKFFDSFCLPEFRERAISILSALTMHIPVSTDLIRVVLSVSSSIIKILIIVIFCLILTIILLSNLRFSN